MPDLFDLLTTQNLPSEVLQRLRELRPAELPHRDTLLLRLALPRTFKKNLYDVAAAGLTSPPLFEPPASDQSPFPPPSFTGLPEVEPVTTFAGRYSIRETTRATLLRQWTTHPDRQKWAETFLRAMDPAQEVESLDRLQMLFWSDQPAARSELRTQFNAADTRHDIPRCSALVQLAAPVVDLIGDSESRRLLNELRARSDSRNVFFSEFFQTESYFPRIEIEEKIESFLAQKDSPEWIFHIHATGGMGKTTLLRRLLSHDWIIGENRVPCAWLDFDFLDVDAVLQAPALLCLPMAAQWNEQLAQPVFGSFLEPTFQPIASVLFRPRSDGAATGLKNAVADQVSRSQYRANRSNPMRCGMLAGVVPPQSLDERNTRLLSARFLRTLWDDKFPNVIGSMPADRPVLMIIDTLEEASLQHGKELMAVLQLMRTLRDNVRKQSGVDLRLILSGRYKLGDPDHVPEFDTPPTQGGFQGQYRVEEMKGFGDTEATDFLKPRIKAHQQALIPAMVKQSLGIPFNLSLFAEWAAADPELKEETILTAEEITTVMLIERIIKRIAYQPLRWIIRYGVVPRSLNVAFLRDVMREPLEEALSGKAQAAGKDRPNQDQWSPEPGFKFDADALWRDYVLVYAAERGWMIPADSQGQAVGFRPDIRNPMRRLLRSQRIFGYLHRRARDWFLNASNAAQQTDAWAEAQVEHIYHSLQLRSYDIAESAASPDGEILNLLRNLLENPLIKANTPLRRTIAEVLCGEDFAEFTKPEKAYVECRLAEAIAAGNNYIYSNPLSISHLTRAFELAGTASTEVLPPFAHQWRLVNQGAALSALLGRVRELPPDDAVQTSILIAELAGTRSSVSAEVLETAIDRWPHIHAPTVPIGVLSEKLAHYYANREGGPDLEKALPLFHAAAEDYQKRGDRARCTEMLRQAAKAELNLGRITRAERVLFPCKADPERNAAVEFQFARIELAKGQPGQALEHLGTAAKLPLSDAESLDALLLRAEALSQRALWQDATKAWQDAISRAQRATNIRAIVRANLGRIRLDYWWMRRIDITSSAIDPQTRRIADVSQADELDVWQLFVQPDIQQAQRRAMSDLGGNSPMGRVRLILMLSQVVPSVPPNLWKQLLEEAARIPVSARILALMEPVLLGKPPAIPEEFRRPIADALRGAPEGPEEIAWHGVRYGELLAWLGFYKESSDLLRVSITRPVAAEAVLAWQRATYRERRRIEQRMREWGAKDVPADPDSADFWWNIWHHTPFRRAAATIENARTAADARRTDIVDRALELVKPELDSAPFRTEFHRIAEELRNPRADAREATGKIFIGGTQITAEGTLGATGNVVSPDVLQPDTSGTDYEIIAMRSQAGRLAVRVSSAPNEDRLVSSDGQALEIMLRSRGIPRRLISINTFDLIDELRDILQQTKADLSGGKKLCFRTPLSALTAAPWELSMPEDGAMLYRSPSGWLEDSAAAARSSLINELKRTVHGYPPSERPSLTMIMPMSPQDRESPQVSLYTEMGRNATSFVPEFIGTDGPTGLLYIMSCFAEPSGLTEPVIAGTETSPSALAHLLQRTPYKPTVVLDVPAVRSAGDYIHQLLLRNFFAQCLLDTGAVYCVIATGLYLGGLMRRIQNLLIAEGAHLAWTQAQIYQEIQKYAVEERQPPNSALFSAVPDMPWLPRGSSSSVA